jgi:hypothetical protein
VDFGLWVGSRWRPSRAGNKLSADSSKSTVNSMRISLLTVLGAAAFAAQACGGKTPPPAKPAAAPARPPAPQGPTRTDFKTIAKKLMQRCVAGGWIERWRSEAPDVDVAKPRIFLREFEDKTGQDLDPTYLRTTLQQRMRLSGVYDMVSEGGAMDFIARGRLLRMAERSGGRRISVYTATLEMLNPKSDAVAYACEATVRGEM